MDNIGQRKLPHKTFKHGTRFDEGQLVTNILLIIYAKSHLKLTFFNSYYLIEFDSPPSIIEELKDHLSLDLDIVKPRVLRMEEEITRPCQNRPCDFGEMTLESRKRLKADLQNCIKKL